jgi:hypothetical protein
MKQKKKLILKPKLRVKLPPNKVVRDKKKYDRKTPYIIEDTDEEN